MKSFYIRFVFLFVFLFSYSAQADECGEISALKWNSELLIYQNELDLYLDTFDENDAQRLGEILSLDHIDDTESTNHGLIKFVPDRIQAEGYPAETHEVITEDGYILQLHRIPYGRKSPKTDKPRPPVFLMHPFLESSNAWIVSGPDHSLAYLLADAGYDVWMGNARGTEVSRRHVRLSPTGWNPKEYWSFSWHEIGAYDLPAFIDYILHTTSQNKLNYVGFSQGTTAFFVMTSMRPEYNDKIIEAQLMAPVVFLKNVHGSVVDSIVDKYNFLRKTFDFARMYKFTMNSSMVTKLIEWACSKVVNSTPTSCKIVLSIIDSSQLNCSSLPDILVNTPAGISLRQGFHFIQLIRSGGFHQFDYDDAETNRQIYGSETPPAYNLTQVTAPINIYHSKDDPTSTPDNVLYLQSILPNVKSRYVVPINDFRHVDFAYSRYIRLAVNDQVMSNINKANGL